MKLVFAAVFIVSIMVLTSSLLQATMAYQLPTRPPGAPSICDKKCGVRCSEARYNTRCLKYCGICCNKCKSCVPSGTSGNKSECPCYNDMLNSKGKPKCP